MTESPRTRALLTGGPFDGFEVEFDDPLRGNWVEAADEAANDAPVHRYQPGEWIDDHTRRYDHAPDA